MPYEVCYRALLSIPVVEGLKPHCHTHTSHATLRRAPARRGLYMNPLPRPALAGLSDLRFHPEDSLAGGPPARWFVIYIHFAMHSIVAASINAATAAGAPSAAISTPWATLRASQRRGGHAWRRGGANERGPKPNAFC